MFTASAAASITNAGSGLVTTSAERTNWNAAFGWGDHGAAGYLTSVPAPLYFTATVGTSTNDAGLGAGTCLKVQYWDIANNDTLTLDSATDGETFTVGSGQGGLYALTCTVGFISTNSTLPISASSPYQLLVAVYKNGSVLNRTGSGTYGGYSAKGVTIATELVLADTDYVEIYYFVRKEDDTGNTGTVQLRGGEYCRWTMRRVGDS